MKPITLLIAVLAATAGLRPPLATSADPQPPKGFTAAFNGKDLTGWHGWAIHDKKAGGTP